MLEKISPPDSSGDKVERNEEDDEDEKFQVDRDLSSQCNRMKAKSLFL